MSGNSEPLLVVDTMVGIDEATLGTAALKPIGPRGVGLARVSGEMDLGTRATVEDGLELVLAAPSSHPAARGRLRPREGHDSAAGPQTVAGVRHTTPSPHRVDSTH